MSSVNFLYQPNQSTIANRDPRIKILFSMIMTITLVINKNLLTASLIVIGLIVLWGIAKLSWKVLFMTMGSLFFLFLSTMIYHTWILRPENDLTTTKIGSFIINLSGIYSGLAMCLQILGIILILSLLVLTTSPIILAEGMEALMNPLKKLKFPVHEGVMMFTISIRFLPVLANEFDKIRKAQIARGNGFHRGSMLKRARGIFPLLLPMFIQSIMRAEELATAMNARCYQGDQGVRTSIRAYKLTKTDLLIFLLSIFLLLLSLYLRFKQ